MAKVLEDKKELTSYHGRIALGILVFQDLVAVGLLTLYGGEGVSPWAALVLLFPLLRQGVAWLLEKSGHEELLVLFGLGMALGSGELFQHVGLSPELGALFTGALLSGHAKSAELTKGLWSLKEAFLVAFFLDIGLREGLQGLDLGLAAGLTLLSLLKAPLFFLVLLLVGYRARTAFVAGMYLGNHSEFALIVGVALERAGLFTDLSALALAVALSMALSAPLARYSHTLYKRLEPFLLRLERPGSHPDAEPERLEGTVLVVGMGRTGDAVYRVLRAQGSPPWAWTPTPPRWKGTGKRGAGSSTATPRTRSSGKGWTSGGSRPWSSPCRTWRPRPSPPAGSRSGASRGLWPPPATSPRRTPCWPRKGPTSSSIRSKKRGKGLGSGSWRASL